MARIDQALWLANENVARFRELLSASSNDFQRKQLEDLLARELVRLKALSQDQSACDPISPG